MAPTIVNKFEGQLVAASGASGLLTVGNKTVQVLNGIITSITGQSPYGRLGGHIETIVSTPLQFAQATIDDSAGVNVTRISVYAQTAGSGGSTGTVIRLTDGVTDCDVTLAPSQNFAEATFNAAYANRARLNLQIFSDDNGSKPQKINAVVQTNSTDFKTRFWGFKDTANNSGTAYKIAQITVDEPGGIYVRRLSAAFISRNSGSAELKVSDGTTDILWSVPSAGVGPGAFEYEVPQDTSMSFITIGTGVQTFSTPDNFTFTPSTRVRITSKGDDANFMEGTVTSYSSGILVMNIDITGGSGFHNDWLIRETTYQGQFYAAGSVLTLTLHADTSFGFSGCSCDVEIEPSVIADTLSRFGGEQNSISGSPQIFAKLTVNDAAGVTILRTSVTVADAGSGGSTGTVIRVSDGTTDLDLTLPPGSDNATSTFSQHYAADSVLTCTVQSDDNGSKPTRLNFVVENNNV